MARMGVFMQEALEAGVLLDTGWWDPAASATVITRKKGNVVVKDGPYTEAKGADTLQLQEQKD